MLVVSTQKRLVNPFFSRGRAPGTDLLDLSHTNVCGLIESPICEWSQVLHHNF